MKVILEAGPFSVHRHHGKLYENISLVLYENDFVHLKGPSGTGKSTLLRQIVGLEKCPAGVKRILNGTAHPSKRLFNFRSKCVYLDADSPLIEGSISENLLFPYKFKINHHRKPVITPKKILEKLGLSPKLDTEVTNLSTGERERLCLARAILFDPQIILADEPFSGLDPESFEKAFSLLYEFSQKPEKAVLCVSHLELPQKSRTLFLKNGKLEELS
ncbi:ABC transporter ATP-binding protein [Thermodesulfatator autotrophicus]|uniref:ABC transporter domain-containing protein n=1 Tax=Thermodesulfatator autotrophicus TaxID=1795632 RepID=A0A177EAL3_9BACT|nr:ATP-binding cassette domain-containing protein [Thermodesulfatator autotrophicus]OAG28049.1 hypothetical protein TH606_03740 [Thermodesulfatator autotrophicus]